MIYNIITRESSQIMGKKCYEGESIEKKVARILEDKEPIKEISERIYTKEDEGVPAQTNIRTDKWEYAIEAMDAASKSKIAKKEDAINKQKIMDKNDKDKKEAERKAEIAKAVKEGMAAEGLNKPPATAN